MEWKEGQRGLLHAAGWSRLHPSRKAEPGFVLWLLWFTAASGDTCFVSAGKPWKRSQQGRQGPDDPPWQLKISQADSPAPVSS